MTANLLARCRRAWGMGVALATAGATTLPASSSAWPSRQAPRVLWQVPGHGRGTPAADGTTAYFLSREHQVVAIEIATGVVKWMRSTGEVGDSTAGSRVVLADTLAIAGDYDIVAFDRLTGRRQWRFKPSSGYGPGLYLGQAAQGRVYAGSPSGRLYALGASSGDLLWCVPVRLDGQTTVFAPIVVVGASGPLVIASFVSFGAPARGGLIAVDAVSGQERWRALVPAGNPRAGNAPTGGPVMLDPGIAVSGRDGRVFAFDAATGKPLWELPWMSHAHEPGGVDQDFRPLVRSGNTLIAGSLSGEVVAYDLETRTERWRNTGIDTSAGFTIASDEDAVYVPFFSGELMALNVRDGRERWRLGRAGLTLTSAPALVGETLLVSSADGGYLAIHR